MIRIIVAVDRNWAIGNKGSLLTSIPEDMKYFRETTIGQVVIMGRKTLESFPGGTALSNRINIVITRNENFHAPETIAVHSVEDALKEAKKYEKDIYVIGGESIYRQMLDYCDEAQVTYIDYSYAADTHFPNLDKRPEWVMVSESEEQTHFDTVYFFRRYLRRKDYRAD